ncbi:hypothetical protein LSTR_LSTR011525 [Laodelphax striatellus]|uniref:Uncharacterized protein n=1 Tax=Laodelphax striatellus TaxID=195883 RepID=A0A482WEJ4_LAOST|nr:hypothetical protein LSTR_LSTR011525 [Laodelphax striatellus]
MVILINNKVNSKNADQLPNSCENGIRDEEMPSEECSPECPEASTCSSTPAPQADDKTTALKSRQNLRNMKSRVSRGTHLSSTPAPQADDKTTAPKSRQNLRNMKVRIFLTHGIAPISQNSA